MVNITILGTSSMVPTKERAPSSLFLDVQGKGILFDCGEGAQRQMNIANINRNSVDLICISHWHADHVAGLQGLLQTINNSDGERSGKLTILGPKETKKRLKMLLECTVFDNHLELDVQEFTLKKPKKIFETKVFEIHAVSLEHSTPVLGFALKIKDKLNIDTKKRDALKIKDGPHLAAILEGKTITYDGKKISPKQITTMNPGAKISYVTDTIFCPQAIDLAKNSDLLICESTYGDDHEDKAAEYKHMTSRQAAQIASMSESKQLLLTHFSQRYKNVNDLLQQAKEVFPETRVAFDLLKLEVK